ncbi:MAG: ribonuclease H-like domain-containing protein [Eubacteriales bacterium]
MILIEKNIENFIPLIPLTSYFPDAENHLFLDIETTGFSAKFSTVYLIGCGYYKDNILYYKQWFAETPEEESTILNDFFGFLTSFTTLIHFNGLQFDLPFIELRCKLLELSHDFSRYSSIDLWKTITPLKHVLKLPNCKQKTVEEFLQIHRDDTFDGGKLIPYYKEYVTSPSKTSLELLLLHNKDDVLGMVQLLPILAYSNLFEHSPSIIKVVTNDYTNYNGDQKKEVIFTLQLSLPLPNAISYHCNDCYLSGKHDVLSLKIPCFNGQLKYFYENYKEYYYLTEEDMAIHQSVASFVDKSRKKKATAATCYNKKTGVFLPQWKPQITPVFYKEFKKHPCYFEITENILAENALLSEYVFHILKTLLHSKP